MTEDVIFTTIQGTRILKTSTVADRYGNGGQQGTVFFYQRHFEEQIEKRPL